jgi:hypothetical protein
LVGESGEFGVSVVEECPKKNKKSQTNTVCSNPPDFWGYLANGFLEPFDLSENDVYAV